VREHAQAAQRIGAARRRQEERSGDAGRRLLRRFRPHCGYARTPSSARARCSTDERSLHSRCHPWGDVGVRRGRSARGSDDRRQGCTRRGGASEAFGAREPSKQTWRRLTTAPATERQRARSWCALVGNGGGLVGEHHLQPLQLGAPMRVKQGEAARRRARDEVLLAARVAEGGADVRQRGA
jgi:hypothetical protein